MFSRSDRRRAHERPDRDAKRIHHVSHGRAFEILRGGVEEVGKAGHGVEGAGAVEYVNVEKGDEGQAELAVVAWDIPFLDGKHLGDLVEVNHLFEEIKGIVSHWGVGEVGDVCAPRPRDDADTFVLLCILFLM